ncbi:MAG: LysR family transcriptional regulator [Acidobacteria bacterium]|nr:LysR family transcriptional regulator [Acidobacteriota bacterium]
MISDYNLYPLHVFRMVARHGTVTRAAAELFISQPAVSAHLKALESHLGATLFERTPRQMVLTQTGRGILDQINRIFVLYDELPEQAAQYRNQVAGEVVIAASSTPGTYLIPILLRRFRRKHPEVIPLPRIGSSARVIELVLEYEAPFGVVGEIRLPESIEASPLGRDQLRLTVRGDDPLTIADRLDVANLSERTLFVREPGSSTRSVVEGMFGEEFRHFARVVEIPDSEAIKQSVAAGLGVAFLSSWACRLEERARVLAPLRDKRWRRSRRFYLVRRADRELTGAAAALKAALLTRRA